MVALIAPAMVEAKGSSSRSSGSSFKSSSSSRSTSSAKSGSSGGTYTKKSTPAPAKTSSKPTAATKTVDAPVKTTSSGKKTTGKASVVDDKFKPKIKGGYTPPAGSTVQYVQRNASFVDYLPWLYIFSMSHRENVKNQEAVVTEPDGTEKTVIIEDEGVDGLLIFNWIVMILLVGGIGGGLVWWVNKRTNKKVYV